MESLGLFGAGHKLAILDSDGVILLNGILLDGLALGLLARGRRLSPSPIPLVLLAQRGHILRNLLRGQ